MDEHKISIDLTTTVDFDNEIIRHHFTTSDPLMRKANKKWMEVLNIRDGNTRKALIALGWTPPQ